MGHGLVEDRRKPISFVTSIDEVTVELENVTFLVRGKGAQRFETVNHAFKHAAEDTRRVCRVGRDVGVKVQWLLVESSMDSVSIRDREIEV